jgi:hypothetical protein
VILSDPELIVVAAPQARLRATPDGGIASRALDTAPLQSILDSEGISLEPLFGTSERRLQQEARALAPSAGVEVPDLSVFYAVPAEEERLESLAERLRQQETIEAAYVKPGSTVPLAYDAAQEARNDMLPDAAEPPATTPDFGPRQGYLYAAPGGIEAPYAWGLPGGRGAGVKIIDCEWGWRFGHEDLTQNQMGVVFGINSSDDNHGTAVLGEISGDRNAFGIQGICPDAVVGASSFQNQLSARTIREAAKRLGAGDIILLEIHRPGPNATGQGQFGFIAIEWWPDDFAAIRYAVSRGIVVVEAAGNGFQNLDAAIYNQRPADFPATWTNPFNPANPSSEAVVVGAGAPPPGTHGHDHGPDRSRLDYSNYGARVDAQGWGREVTTTGYGDLQGGADRDLWYTDRFNGTSSASPIVVGALGCVQGFRRASGQQLLTSATAGSLLRSTGSPQQDAPNRPRTQRIGNRPNLRQLIPDSGKVWHYNQKLKYVYALNVTQAAWAYVDTIGWRRLKPGSADGVTNLFAACCEAAANGANVHVNIDADFMYKIIMA